MATAKQSTVGGAVYMIILSLVFAGAGGFLLGAVVVGAPWPWAERGMSESERSELLEAGVPVEVVENAAECLESSAISLGCVVYPIAVDSTWSGRIEVGDLVSYNGLWSGKDTYVSVDGGSISAETRSKDWGDSLTNPGLDNSITWVEASIPAPGSDLLHGRFGLIASVEARYPGPSTGRFANFTTFHERELDFVVVSPGELELLQSEADSFWDLGLGEALLVTALGVPLLAFGLGLLLGAALPELREASGRSSPSSNR